MVYESFVTFRLFAKALVRSPVHASWTRRKRVGEATAASEFSADRRSTPPCASHLVFALTLKHDLMGSAARKRLCPWWKVELGDAFSSDGTYEPPSCASERWRRTGQRHCRGAVDLRPVPRHAIVKQQFHVFRCIRPIGGSKLRMAGAQIEGPAFERTRVDDSGANQMVHVDNRAVVIDYSAVRRQAAPRPRSPHRNLRRFRLLFAFPKFSVKLQTIVRKRALIVNGDAVFSPV